jgi:hypothetical protein
MKRFFVILMGFCLVAVSFSFANASPILKADVSATAGDGYYQTVNNQITGTTSVTVPIVLSITASQTNTDPTPNSYGEARARADYGSLGVYVSGSGAAGGGGNAFAEFWDLWTITKPGVSGAGKAYITVSLDGTFTNNSGYAGAAVLRGEECLASSGTGCRLTWSDLYGNGGNGTGTFGFPIEFTYGTPFDVILKLVGNAAPGDTVDVYNSAKITGLQLLDSNGNVVTGFDMTAASGHNYGFGAPIPIPAAVWLLGSGLIGLIGIRRFKK